ncbi:hypothetical protein BU16DRAFT_58422 [Lophium mytilinum]|uniref:Uncharacterized protein n=1 Tax=Lophium mytilinum TaxID=390894 RepID=A0A6A6QNQ7_9PEZI|nr:hypothetical protein BU16DRAFT_58422 [Lophium mytilinum]
MAAPAAVMVVMGRDCHTAAIYCRRPPLREVCDAASVVQGRYAACSFLLVLPRRVCHASLEMLHPIAPRLHCHPLPMQTLSPPAVMCSQASQTEKTAHLATADFDDSDNVLTPFPLPNCEHLDCTDSCGPLPVIAGVKTHPLCLQPLPQVPPAAPIGRAI